MLHTVVYPSLESLQVDGPGGVVRARDEQDGVGQLVEELPSPGGEPGVHHSQHSKDLVTQLDLPVHLRSSEAGLAVGEDEAV